MRRTSGAVECGRAVPRPGCSTSKASAAWRSSRTALGAAGRLVAHHSATRSSSRAALLVTCKSSATISRGGATGRTTGRRRAFHRVRPRQAPLRVPSVRQGTAKSVVRARGTVRRPPHPPEVRDRRERPCQKRLFRVRIACIDGTTTAVALRSSTARPPQPGADRPRRRAVDADGHDGEPVPRSARGRATASVTTRTVGSIVACGDERHHVKTPAPRTLQIDHSEIKIQGC